MNDNIGKMLNSLRNASLIKHRIIFIPYSLKNFLILNVLKQEDFLESISIINKKLEKTNSQLVVKYIKIQLKYKGLEKSPSINNIIRISKPSLRVYSNYKNIPFILNGLGTVVLSTSKGIMTGKDAKRNKIGGELLFSIW
uniref:30S ribosomal protein S8 n=1 Tax=Gymnochlora stellata TaxID=67809 RepID=A0A140JZH8_GYMST|nr:30S ribosomal protein S8 [Gymnochlora stellata]BAU62505.1 30S ribosomal protein S8 [Gymnochlora stellata]